MHFPLSRIATGVLATIVATAVPLLLPSQVGAAALPDNGSIQLFIDAPPSITESLDVHLELDGADVTDTACGPLEIDEGRSLPARLCTGLADGSYTTSVTGVGAESIEMWSCNDAVAAVGANDSLTIGGGFTEWVCGVTVSPPGVLIALSPTAGPDGHIPPIYGVELLDADGEVASTDCETDERRGERRWCGPLADGIYTPTATNVPDGFRSSAPCAPPGASELSPEIEISATTPFWFCRDSSAFAPLIVILGFSDATGHDTGWFDTVEISLTSGGVDLSAQCERSRFGSRDNSDAFAEWNCLSLDSGDYVASFSGVPSEFEIDQGCDPVQVEPEPVDDAAVCGYNVLAAPIATTVPDTTTPSEPTTLLPATGSTTDQLLWLGLASLLIGCGAIVAASRRRTGMSS